MITGFIIGILVLYFYWLMWLLWCAFIPEILPEDADPVFTKPKFWQFAFVAVAISYMFKKSK